MHLGERLKRHHASNDRRPVAAVAAPVGAAHWLVLSAFASAAVEPSEEIPETHHSVESRFGCGLTPERVRDSLAMKKA